ncbi:MAG: SUMF1/EgtB/PvdO family nonheme iron enzyme, partial [Alphaproteobacteria bacterium]|nr:SUMF1/EgtB/PvdO family nonheme iron enzyme [Alphaproteobacteria bacterium]
EGLVHQVARAQDLGQALPDATVATIREPVDRQATLWYYADEEPPTAEEPAPESPRLGRFELHGLLGEGGMGRVYRVRDPELDRTLALKVLKPELTLETGFAERFLAEARATASLNHPGVVPVHELGRLPDGRLYFTMAEIEGRTLSEVLALEPRVSSSALRRHVGIFRRACETVAYAHSRGVVHRDLKPANIMVGPFGQVLVVDWGIASLAGQRVELADLILGTPWYMAPEQARGELQPGPWSDVWSLGAVLYRVVGGDAPFGELPPREALTALRDGQLPARLRTGPQALRDICARAMRPDPADRYRDAAELADAISDWLEGAAQRERALTHVAEADRLALGLAERRRRARALREEAQIAGLALKPWDPEAAKAPVWRLEDEAKELEREARRLELRRLETLRLALAASPELEEALERLAAHHQRAHAAAEARGDADAASEAEVGLRAHDRGRWAAYLEGQGSLSLRTAPSGARVDLHRYALRDRRLVPVFERELGVVPLEELELPMGRYLLELRAEGCEPVRYPVHVGRNAHASVTPPGAAGPRAVALPPEGSLGPDERYVPAGWAWIGGDPKAYRAAPRRQVWVEGAVLQRTPVTNAQYLHFLNDLLAQGREQEALRWAPRERSWMAAQSGAMLYGRDADGRFVLVPDGEGDLWEPDWPVVHVGWFCAMAYARWMRERTGQPWRLPGEWEWEKAARGADGRLYPWGDFIDPSWACVLESHPGRPLPASVEAFPVDESPYGLRGMSGGMSDWCLEPWEPEYAPACEYPLGGATLDALAEAALEDLDALSEDPEQQGRYRVRRGGFWSGSQEVARLAWRNGYNPFLRDAFMGFRLARSWPTSR